MGIMYDVFIAMVANESNALNAVVEPMLIKLNNTVIVTANVMVRTGTLCRGWICAKLL